jgi:hypothetical protein
MLIEWIVQEKLSHVFNGNPQGSRLKGRPKTDGGIVYKQILIEVHLRNWKGRSRGKADWEKGINPLTPNAL